MPSPQILKMEKYVAVAHQALWRAAVEAECLRDPGWADDLYQLCNEINRLQEDLLKGRHPRRPVT